MKNFVLFIFLLATLSCKAADSVHLGSESVKPTIVRKASNVRTATQDSDLKGSISDVTKTIAVASGLNCLTGRLNVYDVAYGAITGSLFVALKHGCGLPNLHFSKPTGVLSRGMFAIESEFKDLEQSDIQVDIAEDVRSQLRERIKKRNEG